MEGTAGQAPAVVGEECHIVSREASGPRSSLGISIDDVDAYPNLVLLCPVHHKLVDDNPGDFTVEFLLRLKDDHERFVSQLLASGAHSNDHAAADSVAAVQRAKSAMPALISEMRADLSRKDGECVREFILTRKTWMMGVQSTPVFTYYYEDHDSLDGKVQILENLGLVTDVTRSNVKRYRMSEEFVEAVLTS